MISWEQYDREMDDAAHRTATDPNSPCDWVEAGEWWNDADGAWAEGGAWETACGQWTRSYEASMRFCPWCGRVLKIQATLPGAGASVADSQP